MNWDYSECEMELANELDIYNCTLEHMHKYMSPKEIELISGRIITIKKLDDWNKNIF